MATCKNYNDNGGDRLVIGGTLKIESGATVSGIKATMLPSASTNGKGVVKQGTAVADATSETILATLNGLLASLRTAGVINS